MSLKAMSWALDQKLDDDGLKVLLIAMGDAADDNGVTIKGQVALAKKLTRSDRTIRERMRRLEEMGLIARVQRRRPNGSRTSDYSVMAPNAASRAPMVEGDGEELPQVVVDLTIPAKDNRQDASGRSVEEGGSPEAKVGVTGRQASGPDPSENPSDPQTSSEGDARETTARVLELIPTDSPCPRSMTYHGKRVSPKVLSLAVSLLDDFNREAGRRLGVLDGAGKASPALKQVVGALIARPGVHGDAWKTAVVNTIANPPGWADGQVQLGTIFGERAAEHALANTGSPVARVGQRESASDLLRAIGVA